LLSRLGVLRCDSCGARLVAMKFKNGRNDQHPISWCPSTSHCPKQVTISAEIAERHVVDGVKRLLADIRGSAPGDDQVMAAAAELEQDRATLLERPAT
jgi:hypothetical protein